jgi:serine/threonine-protein kinase HipA
MLIDRAVRKKVLATKPYGDMDYVLALDDVARVGALRFQLEGKGPFLAPTVGKLPPLVRLSALLRATNAIHGETETAQDLKFLLGAGSPLGGARPKAAIRLADDRLAMAKFPKPDDIRDIAAGEILALTLAESAGIRVPEHRLVPVGSKSVSVITRFDRAGEDRIPFISAASLLGLPAGDAGSYALLADAIRQFGHNIRSDLHELWRRLVFSLLASNYDDHLRNHGFLMHESGRWSLSPTYDVNPVPEMERGRMNKTPITDDPTEPTLEAALAAAERFGLGVTEAKKTLFDLFTAVLNWRDAGRGLRLTASTLASYSSAFENPLMEEARQILGR